MLNGAPDNTCLPATRISRPGPTLRHYEGRTLKGNYSQFPKVMLCVSPADRRRSDPVRTGAVAPPGPPMPDCNLLEIFRNFSHTRNAGFSATGGNDGGRRADPPTHFAKIL
jgi:hypothetical protein